MKYYRRNFLGCELIFSLIIISILTYSLYNYVGIETALNSLDDVRDILYGTLATLSGALLGFVITGLSVLLTTNSNERMNHLKESEHYETIFVIFFSTSKYLGILLTISLLGLVLDKDGQPIIYITIIALWALIIVTLRLLRCIWVLERIVKLHILS